MTQNTEQNHALVAAIKRYLEQAGQLLNLISQEPSVDKLLPARLAPDAFDTGLHLAVAIQFAARALCLPTGAAVPEIVEPCTVSSLQALYQEVKDAIESAPEIDWEQDVTHVAGEAQLVQPAPDYIASFAFPNMLFHLSQTYAGLRHSGLTIGKADFDGFHEY